MNIPTYMPRLKGFRYPREIIAYAVWAYHRFALSTADVEDLLAARSVIVSREAIRLWVNRFGRNAKAAKRFFKRLVAEFGEPRAVITPSRDIAAQCTVGQRTNCAAISNRSRHWLQMLTTAPTKV